MIATILQGGLGNQMFMYAMARAMALRNGTKAVFNLHYGFEIDVDYKRKLELHNFNVDLQQNRRLTFDYPMSSGALNYSKKYGFNIFAPNYKYVEEKQPYSYDNIIKTLNNKNVFLEGYWQSEKYFNDYSDIIKNDFEIVTPIADCVSDELRKWYSLGSNLVFIGIRRYQECKTVPQWVLLEDAYYNKAIDLMESKIQNPVFVVFSQQQDWVKSHIKAKSPIVFAKPKYDDNATIDDLYLMTNCKHAIISNSSYYWWGAWLSKFQDGIIIAPDNFSNKDCVCDRWIKMSSY